MKSYINEIFIVRSIACLSIVLLHSLNYAIDGYRDSLSTIEYFFSATFGMFLYFGTPTFILISEILISNSYKNDIPKNFLSKRFKYIIIPYLVMSVFYALVDIHLENLSFNLNTLIAESFKNIFLGDWHGYFVLIIFQFYILHALIYKKIKSWNPKTVLVISFFINVLYLSFFKLVPPMDFPFANYIWVRFNWIPIFGWIFYFFIAYYIGINYKNFKVNIIKYKWYIYIFLVLSTFLLMSLTYFGVFDRSSKRPDMILYTCSLVFLIFIISSTFRRIPKLLSVISRYSYGIYLVHMMFLTVIFKPNPSINFILYIPLTFIGSLLGSITIIYLFNKLPFGKFVAGKVGVKPKKI